VRLGVSVCEWGVSLWGDGRGDVEGARVERDDEVAAFILRWYALEANG